MDCFSAHVGSRPVVNQPKHCVNQLRFLTLSLLFWILPPDLQSNLRDTVEAKREWSLWGCDLSYRDKLSLWVDVHSPGGVPSGQGEGEGLRCPTLDRPRRWASALMAPEGETVSWIHVHMYTHTHLCACSTLSVMEYIDTSSWNTHIGDGMNTGQLCTYRDTRLWCMFSWRSVFHRPQM